jgi:uncharacterized repeat protein (TIGR03843 family)
VTRSGPLEGPEHVLAVLAQGEIELRGRIPWSSNATFLVIIQPVDERPGVPGGLQPPHGPLLGIYKPARGERPLRDFPRGLWKREVAAYVLDTYLGWQLVPPTTARADGPLGPGSLQYCVDAVADEHYFTLFDQPAHHPALRRIAAFDLVTNNADRKGGHCLADSGGHVWAIDNGLCFHAEPKLRTVIWDFAGEAIEEELLAGLEPLARGEVPGTLTGLLSEQEVSALATRAGAVRSKGRYPGPGDGLAYPYPWPLI